MNRSRRVRRWGALMATALAASVLTLAGAAPANAAQGGPDSFGYAFIDDAEVGGPAFSYTDISATGTPVISGDDSFVQVATPFPVSLYGNVYNALDLGTNGGIRSPGSGYLTLGNSCLPDAGTGGDSIFLLWDDLVTTIYTETFGAAPNRTFVVQWTGSHFGGGGAVDFNITFNENSPNMQVRYQTVAESGSGATVGIQGSGGSAGFLQYECNTASSVVAGRAIDFNFVGNTSTSSIVTVTAPTDTAVEGGDPGVVRFARTGDRFSTFNVVYSVSGTATSGDDFAPLSGTVTFPYASSFVDVPITALADDVADPGETVIVHVEFGPYDRAEPSTATVTITEPQVACDNPPDAGFSDVPAGYVHAANIDCITDYGLAEGYPDGTYRPGQPVKRSQMASFVARLLDAAGVALPAAPPDAFTADDGGVHELAINQLAALGIFDGTTGESGETYGVSDPMRRDDMAQILVNAYKVATGEDIPAGDDAFTDDNSSDNEDAINALAAAGVVEGTGGGLYDPAGSVTRGQFASFFARYLQVLVDAGTTISQG